MERKQKLMLSINKPICSHVLCYRNRYPETDSGCIIFNSRPHGKALKFSTYQKFLKTSLQGCTTPGNNVEVNNQTMYSETPIQVRTLLVIFKMPSTVATQMPTLWVCLFAKATQQVTTNTFPIGHKTLAIEMPHWLFKTK